MTVMETDKGPQDKCSNSSKFETESTNQEKFHSKSRKSRFSVYWGGKIIFRLIASNQEKKKLGFRFPVGF